ncbi:hypothetical protein NUW54_g169 [Trametes sanguinea]|uniref:Uncharacterized protein n=2 Tax=Trametes sanguinea TaxID=158606 RepID=A0ACC1QAT7_9APHY|nr:hypothetical protein NUW54_g976 [Trametes sanguinea]KAJ3019100.1 hypothetical protein NUW54_g169 [Trametes sanguinea]
MYHPPPQQRSFLDNLGTAANAWSVAALSMEAAKVLYNHVFKRFCPRVEDIVRIEAICQDWRAFMNNLDAEQQRRFHEELAGLWEHMAQQLNFHEAKLRQLKHEVRNMSWLQSNYFLGPLASRIREVGHEVRVMDADFRTSTQPYRDTNLGHAGPSYYSTNASFYAGGAPPPYLGVVRQAVADWRNTRVAIRDTLAQHIPPHVRAALVNANNMLGVCIDLAQNGVEGLRQAIANRSTYLEELLVEHIRCKEDVDLEGVVRDRVQELGDVGIDSVFTQDHCRRRACHDQENSHWVIGRRARYLNKFWRDASFCTTTVSLTGEPSAHSLIASVSPLPIQRLCIHECHARCRSDVWQGFHPMAEIVLPDRTTKPAPGYHARSQVYAKYNFIDFGISSRVTAQDEDRLAAILFASITCGLNGCRYAQKMLEMSETRDLP